MLTVRWLGVDYGTKRIGVAVGDEELTLVSPVDVFQCADSQPQLAFEKLMDLSGEYGAGGVVVGWPLNMDGTEGYQALLVRKFASALAAASGLDVRLWDERLTSAAADEKLAQTFTHKKKKARHDAVAASVILQDFLESDGPARALRPDEGLSESEPQK